VTERDGIGGPTSGSDLHGDDPTTIEPGLDRTDLNGAAGNGGPRYGARVEQGSRGSHASSKASTAYEVAAALRAQASRAAQATRDAGRRVQDALSTQSDPGAVVANNVVTPADTPTAAAAVVAAASVPPPQRHHPPISSPESDIAGGTAPVGAAAAMAATAPTAPSRQREASPETGGPASSIEARPGSESSVGTQGGAGYATEAPEAGFVYPADNGIGVALTSEYPADSDLGLTQRSPLAGLGEPAAPEAEAAADVPVDAMAPEVAALAPVVAPVIVPATEPGPLSREAGMIAPAATEVSLDARPEVAQLAPTPIPRPAPAIRRSGRVRKARLRLMRVDPWSVMKTAFLLSVALGITLFVAVAVLWSVLDAAGVFAAVGNLVRDLTSSETNAGFQLENYTALSRVLGFTTLIAVVDVVLVTALATLGAFLYNLSASLLGGLEVTLAEDD
jgi:hypothetical protein